MVWSGIAGLCPDLPPAQRFQGSGFSEGAPGATGALLVFHLLGIGIDRPEMGPIGLAL